MRKGITCDQLNDLQIRYDKLKKRHDDLYAKYLDLLNQLQILKTANTNDE
jgi:hypothetical protein